MTDDKLEIGGVARAHGIKGEVAIVTHDDDSTILGELEKIFLGDVPYVIVSARATPHKGWLVALEGVADRNAAELLKGKPVFVARTDIEIAEGDVILDDMIGCAVQKADGTPWGTIVGVDAGEMQDVLIIHDGEVERMLPLVDVFVTEIDVDGKLVTVDPPDGLPETRIVGR